MSEKKNIKDTKAVIMYDLEALKDFKDSKEFFYHFKLLKGNLIDLFKKLKENSNG